MGDDRRVGVRANFGRRYWEKVQELFGQKWTRPDLSQAERTKYLQEHRKKKTVYCSAIFLDALGRLGVVAHLAEHAQRLGDVLCFQHHTPGDLIVSGHKITGSAQRKQRGTLLQHGSILLRQSIHTPALPGIAELTGRALSADDLREAILSAFRQETGWVLEERGFDDHEREAIEERIASRYGAVAWTEKR